MSGRFLTREVLGGGQPLDAAGFVGALGPSAASFTQGAAAGTIIAAITGLSTAETLNSISPNDSRMAISGANLVVGLTASSAGTTSYTVTTSAGRTLAIAVTATAAPVTKVMRGGATGTDAINYLSVGGAQSSFMRRQSITLPHDLAAGDVIEVAVPFWTISTASSAIRETPLAKPCKFQMTMEYPWTEALTGLPTNTRYAMPSPDDAAGDTTILYTPGGMARSYGVFKFASPVAVPAGQKIGFWTTYEWSDLTYYAQILLQACTASTALLQRNEGTASSNTSFVSANASLTRTSVSSYVTGTNTQMGVAVVRTPYSATELSVVIAGNSEEQSNGSLEGAGFTDVSGGYGDSMGNAQSMRGYAMRLWQKLGAGVTQLSKGSDSNFYRLQPSFDATVAVSGGVTTMTVTKMYQGGLWVGDTVIGLGTVTAAASGNRTGTYTLDGGAANATSQTYTSRDPYAFRRELEVYTNPTHVHDLGDTNEISKSGISSASAWASGALYTRYSAVYLGGYLYVCTAGGTSGSSGPSGTGAAIVDGSVTWCCVGPDDLGGTGGQAGAGILANNLRFIDTIRAVLPNVKIVAATTPPLTTSTARTASAYSYDSGTGLMTATLADVSDLYVGNGLGTSGLTPSGFNKGSTSTKATITAIDTNAKTVTYQLATGLAAPTGTLAIDPGFISAAVQTPSALDVAGTSRRSWLNRYKRQALAGAAGYNNVCGFSALADWGRYTELGEPTTPAAETGVWTAFVDSGHPAGWSATVDGGHGVARTSEYAATKIAADLAGKVTA